MDDNGLVQAILRGDLAAFEEMVRKYRQPLTATAYQFIGNAEDAQDLAQETLIDGYRHLRTLRDGSRLRAWLYTILRNKCYRYLEAHQPEVCSVDDYAETLAAPSNDEDGRVLELLHSLPLADREMLSARYLQGLEYSEIAIALGVNIHAARMRCARSREKLRALLSKTDEASTRQLLQRTMSLLFPAVLAETFVHRVLQEVKIGMVPKMTTGAPAAKGMLATWKMVVSMLAVTLIIGYGATLLHGKMLKALQGQEMAVPALQTNCVQVALGKRGQRDPFASSLAIDAQGNIQYNDINDPGISTYDPNGKYLRHWGDSGQVYSSITADQQGNMYLINEEMVKKYDPNGKQLLTIGGRPNNPLGIYGRIQALAVDAGGNIYVLATRKSQVQKYDANGKFLLAWGTKGKGQGQFDGESSITVDGQNNVYVGEINNRRIQKFTNTGVYLGAIKRGPHFYPASLVTDSAGRIYYTNDDSDIYIIDANGKPLGRLHTQTRPQGLSAITVDKAGYIYTIFGKNNTLLRFDPLPVSK